MKTRKERKSNLKTWTIGMAAVSLPLTALILTNQNNRSPINDQSYSVAIPMVQAATLPPDPRGTNIFVELSKKVVPSVVNISVPADQFRPRHNRMDEFFEPFFGQRPEHRESRPVIQSLGTGFIVDQEGLILTNHHVVDRTSRVLVHFTEDPNEKPTEGEVIGRDPELDIALIKVETKRKLVPIQFGDSDKLQVGEYVMAVGNPFGRGHSVSHGIISAKGRVAPGLLSNYIQTDAPINPGNSGGPLTNLSGEVIGINNAIDARAQGIGFAIPSNSVKAVIAELKTEGAIKRGYLGVSLDSTSDYLADQLRAKDYIGYPYIAEVEYNGPADIAGIKRHDIIVKVDGKEIKNNKDVVKTVTRFKPGQSVEIEVLRKGRTQTIEVTVGKRPGRYASTSTHSPHKRPKPHTRGPFGYSQ